LERDFFFFLHQLSRFAFFDLQQSITITSKREQKRIKRKEQTYTRTCTISEIQMGYPGFAILFGENDIDQTKRSSTCNLLFLGLQQPTTMWSGLLYEKWFPRHRQLPFGNTIQSEMDGSSYFMPLPLSSREVIFTSPTVTKVTLYRVRCMIINASRE
jgi:hypothetical protein